MPKDNGEQRELNDYNGRRLKMPKVITYDGTIKIGAYMFPNCKKPRLCIESDNNIVQYGVFNNIDSANVFMDKLADFLGAVEED